MSAVGTVKARLLSSSFDLVGGDFAAERVPVQAQRVGGAGEAPVAAPEHARDEAFFEFGDGVLEVHALVDHVFDELFQSVADHVRTPPETPRGRPGIKRSAAARGPSGGGTPRGTCRAFGR